MKKEDVYVGKERSNGVMECWSNGVMECWSSGVMECWSSGSGICGRIRIEDIRNLEFGATLIPRSHIHFVNEPLDQLLISISDLIVRE